MGGGGGGEGGGRGLRLGHLKILKILAYFLQMQLGAWEHNMHVVVLY